MQNSVSRRRRRRQPIPLYSNPPFSPSQGGPDSDGYSSEFPAARIGTDPPLLGNMPAQPRIERHGSATLENNPSSRVPKSRGKLRHKSKSGLGGKNILNTTSGAPVTMGSHKASTSKRTTAANDDVSDERPIKRTCLTFIDEDDLEWLKGEIRSIKDAIQQIIDKGEEERQCIDDKLDEIFHQVHQL